MPRQPRSDRFTWRAGELQPLTETTTMRLTILDTQTILTGATPAELVATLHRTAWMAEADDAAYMAAAAARVRQWNGAAIRTDTPEQFLADLAAAGLIALDLPR